jgi:hypothetical protein
MAVYHRLDMNNYRKAFEQILAMLGFLRVPDKSLRATLADANDRFLSELPGEMTLGELCLAGPPGSFDRAV